MSRDYKAPSVIKSASANWAAFIYVAVISFFLSPFVLRSLGTTGYGVWSLLSAVVGYLGLLDFGVRGAVTRYIAQYHAVSDAKSASQIASAGISLYGILGVLGIAAAGVVGYFAPEFFQIPGDLARDAGLVIFIGGLTVAATMVGAVYGGVVAGLQRFDVISGIEIVVTTLRTVVVVLALMDGAGLVALAWIHFGGSVLSGLAARYYARRVYPELRLEFRTPLMPRIRQILTFSIYLSAIHVLGAIIYYTGTLVIAAALPIAAVTLYAIAGNLCDYGSKFASAISRTMTPRVSAMASRGGSDVANEVLGACRVGTLITAPMAATFILRGESFINLWMGPEFGAPAGAVLEVLAMVVWLVGARAVAGSAIIGANQHRLLIPFLAGEAVVNLGLGLVLVHTLGVVGVAIGALVPSLIVSLVFIPWCLKKAVGVPTREFYWRAWFLPTLACAPFIFVQTLIERYFGAHDLVTFMAQVLLTLPLVLIVALAVCTTREEKAWLLRRVGLPPLKSKERS
jgi:O-antigen/teichoic acid export membrane protein